MNLRLVFGLFSLAIIAASCAKMPTSVFKYEQHRQEIPSKVTFKNESLNAKAQVWDFGDKQKSTDASPLHEYSEPGTYTVTLTTQNGKKTHQVSQTITVMAPKDAELYNYYRNKGKTYVSLTTSEGTIKILLFDATPKHRDNFIKLVKEGFYNDLLFHRVIKGFMVQGGDPTSKNAELTKALGFNGPGYQVPAEFKNDVVHVKGAIAAARTGGPMNPEKESSGSQFYVVQGSPVNENLLMQTEQRSGIKYTADQKTLYLKYGGTPFLDHEYTVFGQVVEGLDIIDKMAAVKTGASDRPVENLKMTIKIEE
jgi:peptidyl-prolyl cis-trans isomerase B (cyclophilin B)